MNKVMAIVMCVVMIIAGGVMAFFGIRNAKVCTEEVQATVIENVWKESDSTSSRSSSSGSYFPRLSYTYNGKQYEQLSSEGSGSVKYEVGEVITIKINPDKPLQIMMPGLNMLVIAGAVFAVFGVIFAIGIANGTVHYSTHRRHYISN